MNIAELLEERTALHPSATAIVDARGRTTRELTYDDLQRAAKRFAAVLSGSGLRAGDAVLVLQSMSIELYVVLVACARLGLLVMFPDPSALRETIERCCQIKPPDALIAEPRAHALRLLSRALRRVPRTFVLGGRAPRAVSWSIDDPGEEFEPVFSSCTDQTPALLTLTSGSTGQPKVAVRTHGLLLAQHRAFTNNLRLSPGFVHLTTMPVFVLANLASGITSLIPRTDVRQPGAVDAASIVEELGGTSSLSGSPALLARITRHCLTRGLKLTSLDQIFVGGGPVWPQVLYELKQVAPRATIFIVYGSTEAEPISIIDEHSYHAEDLRRLEAGGGLLVGHPIAELRVRIMRDRWGSPAGPFTAEEFDAQCLPDGEPGEIVVSGPHVLPGYLGGIGDAETKFRVNGEVWHRTGDAGYLDPRGLWLLGRCAAVVRDARGMLHPFAVEAALWRRRELSRVAALAHNGSRVLVAEPREGVRKVDAAELLRTVEWADIDEVRVVDRIPMDRRHNAKVEYPALLALLDREGRRRGGATRARRQPRPVASSLPTEER